MSIGRIGPGGMDSAWVIAATDPGADEAPGAAAAAPEVSLDEVAAMMVEADREQRAGARTTRQALAEAVRAERQAAIRAQREAAADVFDSAIVQAVLGGVTAVAQGAAAIGAASAAAAVAEGTASAVSTGTAAAEGTLAGVPWHRWVQIGADLLPHTAPLFDAPARSAEDHRLRAQEHSNEAAWLDDRARMAGDDAEAARAAERSHTEAVSRAVELVEQGRSIAIGREAG